MRDIDVLAMNDEYLLDRHLRQLDRLERRRRALPKRESRSNKRRVHNLKGRKS